MNRKPLSIVAYTILASYTLFFSEWLFQVTKPSFLTTITLAQKLTILAIAPLPLTITALVLGSLLTIAVLPFNPQKMGPYLSFWVPAFILACTQLLLVDNFTHTMFDFYIGTFRNSLRYLYIPLFLACLIGNFWYLNKSSKVSKNRNWSLGNIAAATIFVISILIAVLPRTVLTNNNFSVRHSEEKALPNILILSTDGINANRMSAYGYHRETTPFIKTLLDESLVFDNSFTNAANTPGSIASLLCGKLPTEIRLYYRPDTLHGIDTQQHLPGILRALGYSNGDISLRHYADASDLNLRDSFHYGNKRHIAAPQYLPNVIRLSYTSEIYFIELTSNRLLTRLKHIIGLTDIIDPYLLVKSRKESAVTDSNRILEVKRFINEYPQPFFVHVHLMNTHGAKFKIQSPFFSKGKNQDKLWMDDFVDDAMRDYDQYVKEIVTFLKRNGLYDNTLLILNSDHAMDWQTNERIPLIMKFPFSEHKGRRNWNTQRLDIAPTILDYIGITVPEWMEGQSLISRALDNTRPIISSRAITTVGPNKAGWWVINKAATQPPFYNLGKISLVRCNRWYSLNLKNGQINEEEIAKHTNPCDRMDIPTKEEEKAYLIKHLAEKGYDVSSLRVSPEAESQN